MVAIGRAGAQSWTTFPSTGFIRCTNDRHDNAADLFQKIQRCLSAERSRISQLKVENDRLRRERDDSRVEINAVSEQNMKLEKDLIREKENLRAKDLKIALLESQRKDLKVRCEQDNARFEEQLKEMVADRDAAVEKYKKSFREELKKEIGSHCRSITHILGKSMTKTSFCFFTPFSS